MNALQELKKAIGQEHYFFFRNLMKNFIGFSGIRITVLEVHKESKEIIILIQQEHKLIDKIFDRKGLIGLAQPFIDQLKIDNWRIHVRTKEYEGDFLEVVDSSFIVEKMKLNNISQKEVAFALGIDKYVVSKLINNKLALTRWHKAAFYYYFKSIEKLN